MLKRKIDDFLAEWKEKTKKKCLIIEGPRQIGKTLSINSFAKKSYDDVNYLYIDFSRYPEIVRVFKRNLSVNRLYQELKIRFPHVNLVEGESLLFFDEIQEYPEAISYLRNLTDDGRYDVIVSGGNLGALYDNMGNFPVGYVDRYQMTGLDFEEYLWANGFNEERLSYIETLYDEKEFKLSASHDILIDYFREFMVMGGMPEVVYSYVNDRNFKKAFEIQQNILELYRNDILSSNTKSLGNKIIECLNAIPEQLEKDNKKFMYRFISNKGRASMYESSVKWLIESEIVLKSSNLTEPVRPLSGHVRSDSFRLYLHDTGLLVSMLGEETQLKILRGNVFANNSAVLENVVAIMLKNCGYNVLYHFEKNSTLEAEFIIPVGREAVAVIVKNADNSKSKVMKSFKTKYNMVHGLKLSQDNYLEADGITTIPLYMSMFLNK